MNCRHILTLLFVSGFLQLKSQNTIALLSYDKDLAFDGYNLIFPHNQSDVFLIDNCGEIVNVWEDGDVLPGNSVYLTEEGNLIKCKRKTTSAIDDPIWAGGAGETVEIRSWDNDILAQFELNDSLNRLHHDIAVMPNGNILMIAWELKTLQESLDNGRDSTKLSQDKLWPEVILEWNPNLDSIVWKWHTWDHLIQDFDASKDNFGIVSDHPELIDINYDEHDGHPDWLHSNSIDYNPVLDQIVLSIPYFNEFWIIDHSTTTEEAASHIGGNANKGGDLLYRWGNPQAYQTGDSTHQKLFFQHDVHWSDPQANPGDENFNKVVLFNNRVDILISKTNSLVLPWDAGTNTYLSSSNVFGPEEFDKTVAHPDNITKSNSNSLSSAQLLPNDNFLICSGRWGYTYEITPNNEVVWEYITPILRGQRAEQGDTTFSISSNITFRVKRYGADFEGFVDKDLSAKGYIEMNPDTAFCDQLTVSIEDIIPNQLAFYPNPTTSQISVKSDFGPLGWVRIYDVSGRIFFSRNINYSQTNIDVQGLENGIYFINSGGSRTSKFIKL